MKGAGAVDWEALCRSMKEAAERQSARRADPAFQRPEDLWAPRAESFDRRVRRGRGLDPTMRWLAPRLTPTDTVLDVGAGTGRYTRFLAERVAAVTAIEPSAGMRAALERFVSEGSSGGVVVVPEAWPLEPLPRADVALCAHVVYAVDALAPFLRALDRAAGRLVVVVCGMLPPGAVLAPLWERVHGEPRLPLPGALEVFNLLHQLGIAANFEVISRDAHAHRYETRDEALATLRQRLHLAPSPSNDARVLDALERTCHREEGGAWVLRPSPSDAVLWWQPS